MLEKILIFVVFLAPLIFFHELGHFLFARFFGVRVEVFSLGFGPKIFKYVRNGTEYVISLIPLGGYVKMFGDDPFSEVPLSEEEKKVAFNHKSKWARFWIVFGGPLANILLAYVLYVGLLAGGEKVPETKVGVVAEKTFLYEKGLKTGDILVGINDEKITSFDDLNIKGSNVETIKVKRNDEEVLLNVGLPLQKFIDEFIQITPLVRKPIFVNKAGEKFFVSLTEKPALEGPSLEEMNDGFTGRAFIYKLVDKDGKEEIDLTSESEISAVKGQRLIGILNSLEFYSIDLSVRNIVMASAADKAGIKKGDVLISLNGQSLYSFEELRRTLQTVEDGKAVEVGVVSNGKIETKTLTPEVKQMEEKRVKIIGIESGVEFMQPKLITVKAEGVGEAIVGGVARTWDGIQKTFAGYAKLITREVSLNNIGGPLAIGKVASDSLNISLSMFFRLMAMISINLGVINLFPIPVLDGGHIMFLLFEVVNRGPLSRRKVELAQRFGMSVLFLLIFVALFNDISRLF